MEPFRRHIAGLDHSEWTGLVVLCVGAFGGATALVARLLPESLPFDVPAMGAYASIFMVVGILLYMRGD